MEDTQNNEAMIEEVLRGKEEVDGSTGDVAANMSPVKELANAGYVWIWDTRTYERVAVLSYMLPTKLRFRREDGSFRWTTNDPGKKPKRGSIKCLLHKDSPDREHFDGLGFRACPKTNITNPYQLKQHMVKKHPQEWAAIEEERKERERQEDRELQRLILAGQVPKEKPPLYVSDKDKKKS